ncbi:MAG TPA: hypothetical protein VHR45_09720 [Thermoanaerobaculia bacterium]|nr:hypothetical protein [Thermoanaerobaculia bacterium]
MKKPRTRVSRPAPPAPWRTANRGRSLSKPPAGGFTRTSIDFPDDLHVRLKIAAVHERRPMRELVEAAVVVWLNERGL